MKSGVYNSNISSCCNGKLKSTGGYKWMYADDYCKAAIAV